MKGLHAAYNLGIMYFPTPTKKRLVERARAMAASANEAFGMPSGRLLWPVSGWIGLILRLAAGRERCMTFFRTSHMRGGRPNLGRRVEANALMLIARRRL